MKKCKTLVTLYLTEANNNLDNQSFDHIQFAYGFLRILGRIRNGNNYPGGPGGEIR